MSVAQLTLVSCIILRVTGINKYINLTNIPNHKYV